MKRAIVLAGGGTKGAYQLGVVKAIQELNIQIDIVTGTSIGALNGCLLAQNDIEAMDELWENLKLEDIMLDGMDMKFTIDNLKSQSDLIKPFLKSYINHKGADVTPLKEMIDRLCDEKKMEESDKQFGLVTVEYPSFKPRELSYDQMKGNLKNYLLASASCFPAFPIHSFDGHQYIDGGYFDNLPIDLAFTLGADEVIAVEITYERHTHPHYENRPNITYIRPSNYNGQFLDFDNSMMQNRIALGYNDTMKVIGNYLGKKYTFYPDFDHQVAKSLYKLILQYEAQINRNVIKRRIKMINPIPMTTIIQHKYDHPTMDEYLVATLELVCDYFNIDPLQIYHIDELLSSIQAKFIDEYKSFNQTMKVDLSIKDPKKLKEVLDELSKIDLICYFFKSFITKPIEEMDNMIYSFFSSELLCAVLFRSIL